MLYEFIFANILIYFKSLDNTLTYYFVSCVKAHIYSYIIPFDSFFNQFHLTQGSRIINTLNNGTCIYLLNLHQLKLFKNIF